MTRSNAKRGAQVRSSALAVPGIYLGCAGWSLPQGAQDSFPPADSHLQRYAQVFNAVEINSSFYRTHLPTTYRRWAAVVPGDFRFSVKFPRTITHDAKLRDCGDLLKTFLEGVDELGERLGCLLLQLPPRLAWDPHTVLPFLAGLRQMHQGPVVCEPRHASWFHLDVSRVLKAHGVARAGADPALSLRARVPAGDRQLQYLRLHGAPRMYYDSYAANVLEDLARRLLRPVADVRQRWCIFDNTALGSATYNALSLLGHLPPR
ncbi:DUF72 domain-containing protein [Rhodanobacter sp. TND4FH1]